MDATAPYIKKLVIVGVGLIGGSYALALRKSNAVGEVVGIGRSQTSLARACELGIIDGQGVLDRKTLSGATLVFVATPVGQMPAIFETLASCLDNDTIVTDGGSTKQDVVTIARNALGQTIGRFVPGHPIAGTEHSGPEAAFAELYCDKRVVLTPLAETRDDAMALVRGTWQACGAKVLELSPGEHDQVLAAVSHLPHLLAFALVEELAARPKGEQIFSFAGGGFRDFTRIASSNPEMWRDIAVANRLALSSELRAYRESLDHLQVLLDSGDAKGMEEMFARARLAREKWLMIRNQ